MSSENLRVLAAFERGSLATFLSALASFLGAAAPAAAAARSPVDAQAAPKSAGRLEADLAGSEGRPRFRIFPGNLGEDGCPEGRPLVEVDPKIE